MASDRPMDCEKLKTRLLELLDGTLPIRELGDCRAHLESCEQCAQDVAHHLQTWKLLDVLDQEVEIVPQRRLEQMATSALDLARRLPAESPAQSPDTLPAPLLQLAAARRWPRVAAAAGLLVAVALGARFVLKSPPAPIVAPGGEGELPACIDDPEFVKNFDVIRDLPDLSEEGDLLDLGDDAVALQVVKGA